MVIIFDWSAVLVDLDWAGSVGSVVFRRTCLNEFEEMQARTTSSIETFTSVAAR